MRDKRVRERVPFEVELQFDTADDQIRSVQLQDISMTGLYFETDNIVPVGTVGTVKMYLESGDQHLVISANARVTRAIPTDMHNKGGLGIAFTQIDTDSSIHLFNVIKYQTAENEEDTSA